MNKEDAGNQFRLSSHINLLTSNKFNDKCGKYSEQSKKRYNLQGIYNVNQVKLMLINMFTIGL